MTGIALHLLSARMMPRDVGCCINLACVMPVIAVWHKLLFAEGFCFLYNLLFVVLHHASKTEDARPFREPLQTLCKTTVNVFYPFWNSTGSYCIAVSTFPFICLESSWYLWMLNTNGGFYHSRTVHLAPYAERWKARRLCVGWKVLRNGPKCQHRLLLTSFILYKSPTFVYVSY